MAYGVRLKLGIAEEKVCVKIRKAFRYAINLRLRIYSSFGLSDGLSVLPFFFRRCFSYCARAIVFVECGRMRPAVEPHGRH